jgi:hypothetical protein
MELWQVFPEFELLSVPSCTSFDMLVSFPSIVLSHTFRRIAVYLYVVISSCIQFMNQEHIHSFLCVYF